MFSCALTVLFLWMHPEHLNSDQKNPLAIPLMHLLVSRILKLEFSTADVVGDSVYHIDLHETSKD